MKKFAVEPCDLQSAFRPLDSSINPDHVLCIKDTRQVDNGSAFSYEGTYYRIICSGQILPMPRSNGLKVEYSGSIYDVEVLDSLSLKSVAPKPPKKTRKSVVPAQNHPWRTTTTRFLPSIYDESDRQILEALYGSRLAWR